MDRHDRINLFADKHLLSHNRTVVTDQPNCQICLVTTTCRPTHKIKISNMSDQNAGLLIDFFSHFAHPWDHF